MVDRGIKLLEKSIDVDVDVDVDVVVDELDVAFEFRYV